MNSKWMFVVGVVDSNGEEAPIIVNIDHIQTVSKYMERGCFLVMRDGHTVAVPKVTVAQMKAELAKIVERNG